MIFLLKKVVESQHQICSTRYGRAIERVNPLPIGNNWRDFNDFKCSTHPAVIFSQKKNFLGTDYNTQQLSSSSSGSSIICKYYYISFALIQIQFNSQAMSSYMVSKRYSKSLNIAFIWLQTIITSYFQFYSRNQNVSWAIN